MEKLSQFEISQICNHLGDSSIQRITPILGGHIHSAWKFEFKNFNLFIKKNNKKQRFLKFEEYCLNDLRKYANPKYLIVPKIIKYLEINNIEILIMEWIDITNTDQKNLGKGLAEIRIKSNEENPNKFGYCVKGFIGLNDQINGWEKNWSECFIKLRIKPQLKLLENNIPIDLSKKIISKIYLCLSDHSPKICLVHGDLWSGNVGNSLNNRGVIFDPACWWADNEVDIAMSKLFGGFSNEFYEEYSKVIQLKEGYKDRTKIYNFYHILNHANMFGGNYFNQVDNYIEDILNF